MTPLQRSMDTTTDAESAREEAERLRAEVDRLRAESGAARPDRDALARRIFEALRWGDQPWELLKPWSQDRYRAIADGLPAAVGAAPATAAMALIGTGLGGSEAHLFASAADRDAFLARADYQDCILYPEDGPIVSHPGGGGAGGDIDG